MADTLATDESRLNQVLTFVDGHVKFAETKNAALFAASAAALLALIQLLHGEHALRGTARWYVLGVVAGCALSVLVTLLSFLPVTQIPWIRRPRRRDLGGSLLFFGDAQRYDSDTYFAAWLQAAGQTPRSPVELESMYATQIVVNSRIAARKFTYFGVAIWMLLAGVLTPVVAAVIFFSVCDRDL